MSFVHLFFGLIAVVIAIALIVIAVSSLYWMTHAWWSPAHHEATAYVGRPARPAHSFSLIVPARHENEEVLGATVRHLLAQSHPRVEIILSVGHDDPLTSKIAERLAARYPTVSVSSNTDESKNKPRQLNTALASCSGDVVGVFDAESIAAPDLLMHIDGVMQARNAQVVQGAVQLINYRDSWFALRNCLEYYFWFRSRLHAHAMKGFIPLGGNTIFVARELLEAVDGWDGDCLAEDCDLGVRLSTLGHRITVAYDPLLVTREETPPTIAALVRQRTRWALGFMQVLRKGDWKRLPTRRRRLLAWWTLTQQHLMALTGVCIPVAILAAVLLPLPVPLVLLTFLPALPMLATVAFDCAALREFGRDLGFRIGPREYARLILGTPFYQLLLATAALRAMVMFYRGDFRWEKTGHPGAHLSMIEEPAA
jgi:cellulose synthase/poly-beta-1,6-N-acetylglucosamine synthase-like glycosyltransferase